jgi:hypothetical protein
MRGPASLSISKESLGTRIVEVGEKLRNTMKKRVAGMAPSRLHLLVGKDLETKQPRACLTFISDEDSSNLELNILPLPVSGESAGERISSLTQALKKIDAGLDIGSLAGARNSDGSDEYNFETVCRASIERVSSGKNWDDFDKTKSHGSFDRLVNVVILSSLGMLNFLVEGNDIPAGPSDTVIQAMKAFSGSTQWTNLYARIGEALMDPENSSQKKLFAEIQAILEPLASVTQVLTQSPSKPSGAATLAAIALVLHRYGVEFPQGLLYPEAIKPKEDAALKELRFELVDPKNVAGSKKVMSLKEFTPAGFSFYKCFLQHLIFRLSTKRGNRSCYEVLGLMVDPVMVKYGEFVFGKGSGEWNFDSIQSHVGTCVSRIDASNASTTTTSANTESLTEETVPVPSDPSMLKEFVEIFDKYNPVEYWSNDDMQKKFPGLFRVNLITLAYSANSAVVDPSLARKRMVEAPALRQAAFVVRQAGKSQLDSLEKA